MRTMGKTNTYTCLEANLTKSPWHCNFIEALKSSFCQSRDFVKLIADPRAKTKMHFFLFILYILINLDININASYIMQQAYIILLSVW